MVSQEVSKLPSLDSRDRKAIQEARILETKAQGEKTTYPRIHCGQRLVLIGRKKAGGGGGGGCWSTPQAIFCCEGGLVRNTDRTTARLALRKDPRRRQEPKA